MKKETTDAAREGEAPLEAEFRHLAQVLSGIVGKPGSSPEELLASRAAAVKRLAGISPEDTTEYMLSLQMIGTHEAAMECLRRAHLPDQPLAGRDITSGMRCG
jgi:hypothetical protein